MMAAGVPAAAPAAYVWAGANSTIPAAGRKLMQTKQNVATHASRVADAPLSAAVLAPLLAPGEQHSIMILEYREVTPQAWLRCP